MLQCYTAEKMIPHRTKSKCTPFVFQSLCQQMSDNMGILGCKFTFLIRIIEMPHHEVVVYMLLYFPLLHITVFWVCFNDNIASNDIYIYIFFVFHHFQMRTLLQIWSQKNPVQELRTVPTSLEESLYPREQCVRQRQTWRYIHQKSLKDLL